MKFAFDLARRQLNVNTLCLIVMSALINTGLKDMTKKLDLVSRHDQELIDINRRLSNLEQALGLADGTKHKP